MSNSKKRCVVPGCFAWLRRTMDNLSYHRFPNSKKYENFRQQWVDIIRSLTQNPTWEPLKYATICSRHFSSTSFYLQGKTKQLVVYAVPTVWLTSRLDFESSVFQNAKGAQDGNVEVIEGYITNQQPIDEDNITKISDDDVEILEMDGGQQSEPGTSSESLGKRTSDVVPEMILGFESSSEGLRNSTGETDKNLSRRKLIETDSTDGSTVQHDIPSPPKRYRLYQRFKLRKIPGQSTPSSNEEKGPLFTDSAEIKYLKDRIGDLERLLSQYCDDFLEVSSKLKAMENFLHREFGPKFSTHTEKQNVPVAVSSDYIHKNIPKGRNFIILPPAGQNHDTGPKVSRAEGSERSDPLGFSLLQDMVDPVMTNRVEEKDDTVDSVINQDIVEVKVDVDGQFEPTVLESGEIMQFQLPSYRSNKFISELEEYRNEDINQTQAEQEIAYKKSSILNNSEIRPVLVYPPTLKRPSKDTIMNISHTASKISKSNTSTNATLTSNTVLFSQSKPQTSHGDQNNVNINTSSPNSSSVHSFSEAVDNSSRRNQFVKSDV